MLAAMQLSAQKWGGRLTVNGTAEYKALCVQLAVQNGWTITNPELQHDQEQAKLERFRTARPERIPTPTRSNAEVYNRHHDDVRAKLPGPLATSRLDWMVGNRMRMTGHTQQEIADTLKQCGAQQRPDEQRDWKKYADHTAAAVFGERGNREQERLGKYADAWTRLEGRDPQAERDDAATKAAIAKQQAERQKEETRQRELDEQRQRSNDLWR